MGLIVNKRDYWGPLLWESINTIIREYPENPTAETQQNYKLFFQSLGDVIPCKDCRIHYRNHLQNLSIQDALKSRDDLINFIIDLHNEVNKATGKDILSRQDARNIVEGRVSNFKYIHYIYGSTIIIFIICILRIRKFI